MNTAAAYELVTTTTPFPLTIAIPRSRRAVVTMSGGIDSAVLARLLTLLGVEVVGFFADYGQTNRDVTYRMVERQAAAFGIGKVIIQRLDYHWSHASILHGKFVDEGITPDNVYQGEVKSISWVPARNAVIMLMAGGLASELGIDSVYASFQFDTVEWKTWDALPAIDRSLFGGSDLTPDFMERLNALAPMCYKTPIVFRAPFVSNRLNVEHITALGASCGVNFDQTYSCRYALGDDRDQPCGTCEQCVIREQRLSSLNRITPQ
jgi:7-cyano-7-deazaguanine synthase in queuosine biosynthesis